MVRLEICASRALGADYWGLGVINAMYGRISAGGGGGTGEYYHRSVAWYATYWARNAGKEGLPIENDIFTISINMPHSSS